MIIFSIETSCDETACAVVENGIEELSSCVSSSSELHKKTGGIVPEVAARKQVEYIIPVVKECLEKYGRDPKTLNGLAVTIGPGLAGSLIVGVEAAKTLSFVWDKPLIPVNHLVGHIYGNFIGGNSIQFPAVVLVVSGGHTDLVLMRGHGDFEFLGGTVDDAAGEAFDKTARLLGISKYLGGKKLSETASRCKKNILLKRLPRPMLNQDNFDFSFSGLKTAVKRLVEKEKYLVNVVACEFENAVVDVLVAKTVKAIKKFSPKSVLLGGGVSANTQLRTRMNLEAKKLGVALHIPPPNLCTDNAVYIASAAFFNNNPSDISKISINPSLGIMDST